MFPIMQLVKWKQAHIPKWSHSALVDFQQIHVRNIFLFCFGLSMSRQFFGANIICQLDGNSLSQDFADTKCFINSTFTNFSKTNDAIVPVLYHDYYQWISIVLLMLAINIHFPFRIWSKHVSQFIKEITANLKTTEDCTRVIQVIQDSRGDYLFWKTFGLECAYFIHLVIQIVLLDWFFNHMWSLSGWSYTVINMLFPETALCFYEYYTGGGNSSGRFRCLLPLNSVYRKIFWVLYSLYLGLLVLHASFFVYRLFLAIYFGKKWINMWWSIKIAKGQAQSWSAKNTLHQALIQRRVTLKEREYLHPMNNLITL